MHTAYLRKGWTAVPAGGASRAALTDILPFWVNQLYVHTNDIDVKSFSGYSRDVGKWF